MQREITKKYSNGDITIVWKPTLCIHSGLCWKGQDGLREVFDPHVNPWINPHGASSERIIAQIQKCPSGALSYIKNNADMENEKNTATETRVELAANGPLLIHGNIVVKDHSGKEERKSAITAFCRCGMSQNKPYCDGSHRKHNFVG